MSEKAKCVRRKRMCSEQVHSNTSEEFSHVAPGGVTILGRTILCLKHESLVNISPVL